MVGSEHYTKRDRRDSSCRRAERPARMGSVSMSCPPVVRRALVRVGALLLVALAVVWGGGWQWSRQRLGPTPADTRRLVEAEARARMARLTGALDAAVQTMAADGALVERAAGGDGPSITALFAAVALDDRGDAGRIAALTVYGVDGAPLAWDGRPSTLPASRPFSPPCSSCCSAARCSWRS